jgi:hypothetical protein
MISCWNEPAKEMCFAGEVALRSIYTVDYAYVTGRVSLSKQALIKRLLLALLAMSGLTLFGKRARPVIELKRWKPDPQ